MWKIISQVKKPEEVEPERDTTGMSQAERYRYWKAIIMEARKVYALCKKHGIEDIYFVREDKP